MNKLNTLDWITLILLVIVGLNWGLIGILDLDLVAVIFGEMSILSRIIYLLVGLSGLYVLLTLGRLGKK